MHLSHLNEDLERWWSQVAVHRPAARDDAPRPLGARQDVHDRRGRLARRERRRRAQRPGALRRRRSQRDAADRLAAAGDTRDAYGVVRTRGTAIIQRADFNTLDNPFASSAVAGGGRRRRRPPGCTSSRSRRRPISSTARGGRWTARSATARRYRSTRARRRSGSTRSSTRRTARTSSRRRARIARSRSSTGSGSARDLDRAAPGQRVLALVGGAVALVRLRRLRAVERRRVVVTRAGVGGADGDRRASRAS